MLKFFHVRTNAIDAHHQIRIPHNEDVVFLEIDKDHMNPINYYSNIYNYNNHHIQFPKFSIENWLLIRQGIDMEIYI